MFKLLPEANGRTAKENAVMAKTILDTLPAKIPSLKKLDAVINLDEADPTNYEIALICDFESMADLDAYQVHPAHKAFGAFICEVRSSRSCIDYEVED